MTQRSFATVTDGIRKFIRALGLENMQSYQLRQVSDEHDLVSALESIKYFYNSYVLMHKVHSPKTKGNPLSKVMEDTQKDMEEYLLRGTDERESMLKWMKNGAIYVLVVEPTIALLATLPKEDTSHADAVVDEVINMVNTSTAHGDHDDAVVAKEQIRHMLAKYRELHPSVAKAKQPIKPRKKRSRQEYSEPDDGPIERFNVNDTVEALDFN
jgi:hypothetical protein